MKKVNLNENERNEKKNDIVDETTSSNSILEEIKEINKNIEKIFNFFDSFLCFNER